MPTWSHVISQAAGATGNYQHPTIQPTVAIQANDLILVTISDHIGGSGPFSWTISDNVNGSYANISPGGFVGPPGGIYLITFAVYNPIPSLANTVTITPTASGSLTSPYMSVMFDLFRVALGANYTIDNTGSKVLGTSATPISLNSALTVTGTNLIYAVASTSTSAGGSEAVAGGLTLGIDLPSAAYHNGTISGYVLNQTTSTIVPSFTTTASPPFWAMVGFSFSFTVISPFYRGAALLGA